MITRGFLIIALSIVLPLQSYALSPLYSFRHLYEQSKVSPSPSPSHGVDLASGGLNFQQSCNRASRGCQLKKIAACLTYSQSGAREEICLLMQNMDENPLHVKILILPTNNTIEEIDLQSHQMKKIKISSEIDSSAAIALNTSVGDCVIHAAAPPPEYHVHDRKYSSSYSTYITPINGAYVVILLFIIGGTLSFVKSRIHSRRRLDKVAYHELQMENSTALSSLDVEENGTGNWDEDWDDEWGDEKSVKSGGQTLAKLPNFNGRRKERDD